MAVKVAPLTAQIETLIGFLETHHFREKTEKLLDHRWSLVGPLGLFGFWSRVDAKECEGGCWHRSGLACSHLLSAHFRVARLMQKQSQGSLRRSRNKKNTLKKKKKEERKKPVIAQSTMQISWNRRRGRGCSVRLLSYLLPGLACFICSSGPLKGGGGGGDGGGGSGGRGVIREKQIPCDR